MWEKLWVEWPAQWAQLLRVFCRRYDGLGVMHPKAALEDDGPPVLGPTRRFPCDECGRTFATLGGVKAHAFRVHGRRNPHRRYVGSDTCPVCSRRYWTRLRVTQHIRDTPRCSAALEAGAVEELPADVVDALDAADSQTMRAAKRAGRSCYLAERPAE